MMTRSTLIAVIVALSSTTNVLSATPNHIPNLNGVDLGVQHERVFLKPSAEAKKTQDTLQAAAQVASNEADKERVDVATRANETAFIKTSVPVSMKKIADALPGVIRDPLSSESNFAAELTQRYNDRHNTVAKTFAEFLNLVEGENKTEQLVKDTLLTDANVVDISRETDRAISLNRVAGSAAAVAKSNQESFNKLEESLLADQGKFIREIQKVRVETTLVQEAIQRAILDFREELESRDVEIHRALDFVHSATILNTLRARASLEELQRLNE